ncbi:MAG TPA: methyltransferase domain-containing protein [Actinomycetota bacterium]|nr:methyltransferase domain-containing protein [Actinomycetota bacterium]
MEEEREIAKFFDCCETPGQRKMNTRISRRARAELVSGLQEIGLEGRSILEIGSGPGELTRLLVQLGAARAHGIDLAEKTLEEARKRAAQEGLSDKIDYRVGNGAKEALEPHDIVVLDKVICCYPDWHELVDNTSAAAKHGYGFVIPRSQGLSAFVVRAFIAIVGLSLKLRKCGFSPFVHNYLQIDSHLRERGFTRKQLYLGPIWMTAVYTRP